MAARATVPFIPLARWSNGDGLAPVIIPPALRSYKGRAGYGHPQLAQGEYLVWSEPFSEHRCIAVVGFTAISGSALVALVDVETGKIERSVAIPGRAAPPRVQDAYVWAQRVAITSAIAAIRALREQHAAAPSDDGEAWLKRQLAELADGS